MELFFDLVYVFAVTQLSHKLLRGVTARAALETLVLFGGVWWAWNYTAWATNWIDPDRTPVRVLLLVLMALSLVMSAAIPTAFGGQGVTFAVAYVAMQLVRGGFMVFALRGQVMGRNYAQLLAWSAFGGVAWVTGALVRGDARLVLWIVALVIDYGAPAVGFVLPWVGRTAMRDWSLSPGHLAERCQLVVIIALGRGGYAYAHAHAVMVAGVIVTAVGDELVIAHPTGGVNTAIALCVLGGAALFASGMAWFVFSTQGLDQFERAMTAMWFAGIVVLGYAAAQASLLLFGDRHGRAAVRAGGGGCLARPRARR
jgi:low temperature requirement protein LtrA